MNTERLEWLPLSSPPAPPAGPPTAGSPEAAARACPTCGWPLAPGTVVCSHCGGSPSDDPLAGLDIQLPQRVVEVMPPPDRWFDGETALDPPALYDLRLRAERMHTTTGFDRLICLDDISVDHYEHQLEAALRALRDMRGRALLADEVGLGKTIEAGIVMKELIERGLVASVLILVPAPLTWQWHEEMLTKFHEDFVVLEDVEQLETDAPATRLIISLDRAKSNGWSERLLAREYDMLIVDEAHKLKNRATQVYRFVDAIRKRYVLMLTATPVHNDLEELYNLVTILRPGHLGTRRAFRRDFVAHAGPRRRVVTWSSQAYGVATYINKANSEILTTEYLGFRPEVPDKALALDKLTPPPLSDDWIHKVEPEDLADFAQAKSELTELLHQGYRIDHARLVRYKDNNIYGFRVELSKSIVETETKGTVVASTSLPTKTKHLPPRRNIYTRYWNWPPHSYLRKSHEARRAYRQDEATSSWILKRIENFSDLDISKLKPEDQKEAEEIRQLIDRGYEVVDFEAVEWIGQNFTWDKQSEGLRTDFVCRLKLKPQPRRPRPRKRAPRDERHTTPRNPSALRGLLQEVMIRNRRSSVSVRFPPRKASVYTLALTPPERALYDGVTAYIRERLQSPSPSGRGAPAGRGEGTLRLTLMTLQRQLCSSPQAVARTLEKLVEREADPRLAEYLTLARSIEQGRKVAATQIILEQYPGKFLIFTDYLPTLHALRAALDRAGHETVVYHGGLSPRERVETVRAFRLSARVMISTQSGGEGHNLQFCHQMINYDLPWNPMRIEQRIGRIHRLGQQHEVAIFNLSAADTIEAYVLDLLARKIRMFELVIGELDLILGALDDERGFEDYVREAWAGSRSEAELLRKIAELEALIAGARHTYEQIRTASDELSEWAGE